MVHRLRPRPYGFQQQGRNSCARALACERLAGFWNRGVARDNELLASKRTDSVGHIEFDPGFSRGTGGTAPGLLVAEDGKGDYGFLDIGTSAFDLSDRGVKGRAAPAALDAFVYSERGVYRSGETVFLTALLRDGAGTSVPSVPLTLIINRPDGVEYKRVETKTRATAGAASRCRSFLAARPEPGASKLLPVRKPPPLAARAFLSRTMSQSASISP
jgi:alpha-2-macroglobulin